nr:LysR substrate-binding domain-containing protein [Pseudomonas sp. 21LCFQ02]
MVIRVRTRHIEIFRAAHRTGSLTKAAEWLCISQPAASKLLAHAEASLGFRLLDRVKGRLQLTREGEALVPAVERMYRELEEIKRLSRSLRANPQGQLKLGCIPTLGLKVLPRTLAATQQANPGVTLELTTAHSEQLAQALLTREMSMAVVFNPRPYPGLKAIEVGSIELVCVDGTNARTPVALDQLDPARVIALPAEDPLGTLVQTLLPEQNSAFKVQTYYVACALAQSGAGVAIIDELTAQALLEPDQHARALLPSVRISVAVLVHEAAVLSVLETQVLDRLRAVLQARD